jgi:hypothetical protein
MDSHDRCIPNSIRILGGRTRDGIWVGSQSRLLCPQDRVGGTLRRRGADFLGISAPAIAGSSSVRRCLVALGGLFTTWHFIVVISAQQGCAKDGKAELPGKASALARNDHTLLAKSDPLPPRFGVTSASPKSVFLPAANQGNHRGPFRRAQAIPSRALNTLRASGADDVHHTARLRRG